MIENYLTAYWIKIFATLAVFVALIVMFIRQSRDQANADPQAVVNVLNQLDPDYSVVSNVVVPGERGIIALGNVVVSPYGVFVITVKQDTGKVFGREGDSEWEVKSGRNSNLIRNPLWENRKHVNALEKVIGSVPFNSIVVFPRAVLKGTFGSNVVRLGELRKKIAQNKTSRLSLDKRDEIIKTLRKR
jgi:hypothetical protein